MSEVHQFRQRRDEIQDLLQNAPDESAESSVFKKWHGRTQRLIDSALGATSSESGHFRSILFRPPIHLRSVLPRQALCNDAEAFARGCNDALALLDGIIEDMEGGVIAVVGQAVAGARDRVVRLIDRFHRVARQLAQRHRNRPAFEITDEYDAQDLLRALLQVDFDDVRPEEPTPSSAGGGSRIDFLLKDEDIGIEVKVTRDGLTDKKLRDELSADFTRYAEHPQCRTLYCFVYDPDGRLKQPAAIEKDLSKRWDDMEVIVVVSPRN